MISIVWIASDGSELVPATDVKITLPYLYYKTTLQIRGEGIAPRMAFPIQTTHTVKHLTQRTEEFQDLRNSIVQLVADHYEGNHLCVPGSRGLIIEYTPRQFLEVTPQNDPRKVP